MKNLAFVIALIGILSLLIFISNSEPKSLDISSIDEKDLNKIVKIIGTSGNVKVYENNFTTFSIDDNTKKITIVCTCPNIKSNKKLEIIGRVTKYQNKLQIQADLIKIVI